MAGIFHAYYTVALAPAVAALVGIGAVQLWALRGQSVVRLILAGTTVVTATWASALLGRSADFVPWLRSIVLIGGLAVAITLLVADRLGRRAAAVVAAAAVLTALAGPASYAIQTAGTAHTGSIVTAGPTTGGGMGGGMGGGPGGGRPAGGPGGFGGPGGNQTATPPQQPTGTTGTPPNMSTGMGGGGGAGGGGLLGATTPSSAILAKLGSDASSYRWVAATVGANNAAGYQLASGHSVMPIGGFNGSDPSPTLAQFEAWVNAGRIHWFVASGSGSGGGMSPGGATASAITQWVEKNFTATTVDGVTMYDLSGGTQ